MSSAALITGGSGLLALNWALSIRERYRVVLGVHRRSVSLAGVETISLDLDSRRAFRGVLRSTGVSLVVHTAGLTSVEACEADPELAHHINVVLAENVAAACAAEKVRLVHISTDHLFGGEASMVTEQAPVSPPNAYGRSKADAERQVLAADPAALVVRTNFYGWGPSYRRSFSDTIIDALRSAGTITLFEDVTYTPIVIEELVRAVHELVERKASGIFNVTGDECVSKYEFGHRLAARFQLDPTLLKRGRLTDQTQLVQRPFSMSLSNEKARALLGRPLGNLDDHMALLHAQELSGRAQEVMAA